VAERARIEFVPLSPGLQQPRLDDDRLTPARYTATTRQPRPAASSRDRHDERRPAAGWVHTG
jgi:hypothetical protein